MHLNWPDNCEKGGETPQARELIVGQTNTVSPISEHALYLTLFASSAGGL